MSNTVETNSEFLHAVYYRTQNHALKRSKGKSAFLLPGVLSDSSPPEQQSPPGFPGALRRAEAEDVSGEQAARLAQRLQTMLHILGCHLLVFGL